MRHDSRTETFARVGRSYPRIVLDPAPEPSQPLASGHAGRYLLGAGLVGLLAALGLIGWLLAR
jgi:hypothetical protein